MHNDCCCVASVFFLSRLCCTRIDSFVYPQPEKKLESLSFGSTWGVEWPTYALNIC